MNARQLALILVASGSAANSVNGLILRSMEEANEWQIVFYRSISLAASLVIVFLIQTRGRIHAEIVKISRISWCGAVAISVTNIGFVWSIQHTTVANTMFVLGAIPFFTAVIARVLLKEPISPDLALTIAIAFVGVSIMMSDGLVSGTLFGNIFALITALGFSSFVVILRHGRAANLLPIIVLGALLSVVISLAFTNFDVAVPVRDAFLLVTWGALLSAGVQALITYASRHVQGAELSLMAMLEFVLAPIWVLAVYAEQPTAPTLVGGALVLLAVLIRGIRGIVATRTENNPIG